MAADLRQLTVEQAEALFDPLGSVSMIDFSTVLPLNGSFIMTQHAMIAALAFTLAGDLIPGSRGYLRLVADGASLPTFPGMKEWGGSLGYDNRAGILNSVDVFFDGYDTFYSFSQAVGASPTPTAPGAATNVVATAGDGTASVAFVAPLNTGNSAITGYTATSSTGKTASGANSPINVAGLANGTPATFTVVAHNAIGDSVASAPSNSVTPSAAPVNNARLISLDANTTESGSPGAYTYSGTGLGFGSGVKMGGILNESLQAGVPWTVQFKRTGTGSEIFIGLTAGATPVFMNQLPVALMSSFNHGFYTSMINGAEQAETNDQIGILDNDLMELRGSADHKTVTSSVSKDAGATWTDLYTWTNVDTSLVHVQMSIASQPGTISQIAASGVA